MRPITIFIVSLLCTFGAAQNPPASPSAIVVHVWTDSGNATREDSFNIDLNTGKSTSHTSKRIPPDEKPGWANANILDRKRNLPTYERIVERFKAGPQRANNSDLTEALRWLEQTKGTGYEPGDFVVASPDGKHAVIKDQSRPLLLIDVATLNTLRLLDDAGDEAPTVAWSSNSRYLVFASLKSPELRVYDLERQATSVVARKAPWIGELSFSPDAELIAAFAFTNRRMDKNPFALVAATAGHPIFRDDGVVFVYRFGSADKCDGFSVPLKRGISEQSTPRARIEWK